jgi:hypothetical protein
VDVALMGTFGRWCREAGAAARDRIGRTAARVDLLVLVVAAATVGAAAFRTPGYDVRYQAISVLSMAGQPMAAGVRAAMVLAGVAVARTMRVVGAAVVVAALVPKGGPGSVVHHTAAALALAAVAAVGRKPVLLAGGAAFALSIGTPLHGPIEIALLAAAAQVWLRHSAPPSKDTSTSTVSPAGTSTSSVQSRSPSTSGIDGPGPMPIDTVASTTTDPAGTGCSNTLV